jgi:hypothetical protein
MPNQIENHFDFLEDRFNDFIEAERKEAEAREERLSSFIEEWKVLRETYLGSK